MADSRLAAVKPPPIRPGFNFQALLEQELMQGTSLLLFDLDRCTRCDECVRACAASHGGVTRLKREGLRFDKYLVPTSCRSCRDPVCLTECPVGSIGRSPTGAIIIEDWCIGCRKCEENCPYGNIEMHLFDVQPDTELFKQQAPVRLARIRFDPPASLDLNGLPLGLSYDARSGELEYAAVPGAAAEAELNAVCSDAAYRSAIQSLMRSIETRIALPTLPADFKPPPQIENVVKLKRASRNEPDNALVFRGVIDRSNMQQYLSASQNPDYRRAVEQAAGASRGMKAVLSKAVVCDLCESVQQEPNCVYACPHDAALRVDADQFFKHAD
jgi:Fe-S-cluster-containing hydrogenase component 2